MEVGCQPVRSVEVPRQANVLRCTQRALDFALLLEFLVQYESLPLVKWLQEALGSIITLFPLRGRLYGSRHERSGHGGLGEACP